LSDEARRQFSDWSEKLSYPVLHRLWQLLLKGYQEVQQAHRPREACEMALLRVLCAADMPDPGKLAKMLEEGVPANASEAKNQKETPRVAEPVAQTGPAPVEAQRASGLPDQFTDAVKAVGRVSAVLESILIADMRVISFEAPNIVYQPARPITDADISKIADVLKQETGQEWTITEGQGEAQPSLVEQEQQARDAERQAILDAPMVKAAFEAFPDAQLLEDDNPHPQESRSA
jgi:DNA polymerase-3 subunit gamma/tau